MLWHNPRLQICVVQELRGNDRVIPPDRRDQGKQVRRRAETLWSTHHHSVFLFITTTLCFPCRSKAIFNTPEEEDIGIYSCLVTHTNGASSSYTLSEEGRLQSLGGNQTFQEVNTVFDLLISFSRLFSELKRLLEISHDHKFPSECFSIACHLCCWAISLSWLSLPFQTSYSPEVRDGCGAAGEG